MLEKLNTFTRDRFGIDFWWLTFITVLIIAGTAGRLLNLFNLGSFFDLVVTQFDWGKYQFENGIYNFWKDYDKTFDYMPGAFYLDLAFYSLSRLFGGTEQQFVTIVKIFNWIIDLLWVFMVYFVANSTKKSKQLSLLIASIAYAVPSVWIVSGVWGQIDSVIALLGIIAIYFYYFSEKSSEWFLSKKWYEKNIKYFSFFSALTLTIGYNIKPTILLSVGIIGILILSRKDWRSIRTFALTFFPISLVMFIIPLLANPIKLGKILIIPFGASNPSRGAGNIWYLLDIEKDTFKSLFDFGPDIHIQLMYIAFIIFFGIFGYYLFRRFRMTGEGGKIKNFFKTRISFLDVNILYFVMTSAYFIFFVSVHSRYYMAGMLVSFLVLAAWNNYKTFKSVFLSILLLHVAFFFNQLWLLRWQNQDIHWLMQISYLFTWDAIKFAAIIYVTCFLILYMTFLHRIDQSETNAGISKNHKS